MSISVTPEQIMADEAQSMGRFCKGITYHCVVYRDHNDVEHESWFAVYDCSLDNQGQTRWTVWTDGAQAASGIVKAGAA